MFSDAYPLELWEYPQWPRCVLAIRREQLYAVFTQPPEEAETNPAQSGDAKLTSQSEAKAPVGQSTDRQKAPIPTAGEQQALRKGAENLYGDRFRMAETATEKSALAKEILEAAMKVGHRSVASLEAGRRPGAGTGRPLRAVYVYGQIGSRGRGVGDPARISEAGNWAACRLGWRGTVSGI
jgi:hypothetical protein